MRVALVSAFLVLIGGLWMGCEPASEPLQAPSLLEALVGLVARSPLAAEIDTTLGTISCELFPERTPRAVALFVGLARGRSAFRDPKTQDVAKRPYFRGLPFFRAIPEAMIQSGCPLGNGTGHPGYRIAVESAPDDRTRLMQPGALLLARYRPAPNRNDPKPPPAGHVIGSQFVISLVDMSHLAGEVTVIGRCRSLEVVREIARRVSAGQRPLIQEVRFPGSANDWARN